MATKTMSKKEQDFLQNHLNIWWLRPESALWDAIASETISRSTISSPSLDLGCGNGLFSFITAGGSFSFEYDWFRNVNVVDFWKNADVFDTDSDVDIGRYVVRKPRYRFSVGLDHKINLLNQAKKLDFYDRLVQHDANEPLPFEDGSFKTVFSNILYWLNDPSLALKEISRILEVGGRAIICVPNSNFYDYCPSYRWKESKSRLLELLNRGRADDIIWLADQTKISNIADKTGFSVVRHDGYLSQDTLTYWDVGLRPVSPYLIFMANKLASFERLEVKREWIDGVKNILVELYVSDKYDMREKGFHLFELKKMENCLK